MIFIFPLSDKELISAQIFLVSAEQTHLYFSQIVFSAQYLRWAFDIGKLGGPETDEVRAK
jgi:hypothetical protein